MPVAGRTGRPDLTFTLRSSVSVYSRRRAAIKTHPARMWFNVQLREVDNR
jgi:hypothetical protein